MKFENIRKEGRVTKFTLSPIHVSYANTLRRLIMTGVETIAFCSDMTSTGSTTDVVVKKNDTPMTNEMLADRIGLIPINITDPLNWKDKYVFTLNVVGDKDTKKYVTASDFKVSEVENVLGEEEKVLDTNKFFPPNPITGDTCLIATLQAGSGKNQQSIEINAKARKGTGREHARFSPTSQCSYEYTQDLDPQRIEEMFQNWLTVSKKAGGIEKDSDRYKELNREFNTMQIKHCFKINEKEEPYSFDFTVETIGVLSVEYIIERACEVGENMCSKYVNIDENNITDDISISSADSRIIGFDFLIRGHDHTLGNLLQTWLTENDTTITYAGYCVPHPLRDEMILRIGVEDGSIATACKAFTGAIKGCVTIFQNLRSEWRNANGKSQLKSKTIRRSEVKEEKMIS